MKMNFLSLLFIFFLFLLNPLFSQSKTDIELLKKQNFEKKEFQDRSVKYGFTKGKRSFNPFYHILSSSMFVYQKFISAQLSRGCAFNPSCSEYSKELIKEYGILKGTFLTSDRLTRCTRIALSDKPHFHFETYDKKIHETADRYRKDLKVKAEIK